jgi:Purple acid Phosphatase, N-terminal domain
MGERLDEAIERLDDAREELLAKKGVVGVGYGPKERQGEIVDGEVAIVVYVMKKKDEQALGSDDVVPPMIGRIATDVVEVGSRRNPRLARDDFMWIDWALVHEQNPLKDVNLEPEVDYDLDNVAIVEIDDSFLTGGKIDLAKASKRFLAGHADIFDFITFFVDTDSGLPAMGSFHRGVYNKTSGINYSAGSNLDSRSGYGSSKLLAVHVISGLNNFTMLQEVGHMWAAYVRNCDTATSARRTDLLISSSGQGMFHWGRFFDDDHSPMDYDGIDWHPLSSTIFEAVAVEDDFFHYCPLDLYLMGLIPPSSVGSFYVIQNPSGPPNVTTGTRKMMTVQNVIWAEGDRSPAYPNTQKLFKQAFVVLTKDRANARTLAEDVAAVRREFTWQFYKATRFLGRVDTALVAASLPAITNVQVATDDDVAVVGWKTNISTKGKVNYALSPTAFERDRSHADIFTTATETTFGTSHGLRISGLQPNRTYYFEIVAESASGQVHRSGVHRFATRATPDRTAPDIGLVGAIRIAVGANRSVVVSWSTDELSDSRVFYGIRRPPLTQKYDAYPTRTRTFRLPVTTRFIAVESRDAAGNRTRDDNGGAYYEVFDDIDPDPRTLRIDDLVRVGDVDGAIEETSALMENVVDAELDRALTELDLPEDDLEAGFAALRSLIGETNGGLHVIGRGDDFIELAAEQDPLAEGTYIDLPSETVIDVRDAIMADLISRIRPSLTLEVMAEPRGVHYLLRKT